MKHSALEAAFDAAWMRRPLAHADPVAEYRFAPPRRWRFDRAWPHCRVAVELEGGVWSGGRHTRGAGFVADCEKYNTAVRLGWRVLRYTATDLKQRPAEVVAEVVEVLRGAVAA